MAMPKAEFNADSPIKLSCKYAVIKAMMGAAVKARSAKRTVRVCLNAFRYGSFLGHT